MWIMFQITYFLIKKKNSEKTPDKEIIKLIVKENFDDLPFKT